MWNDELEPLGKMSNSVTSGRSLSHDFTKNRLLKDMEGIPNVQPEVFLTPKLKKCLTEAISNNSVTDATKDNLKPHLSDKKSIPFDSVKLLNDELNRHREASTKKLYLHDMLEGSDWFFPEYVPPPRNPELEARIQKIKEELANREYDEMTKNVASSHRKKKDESIGSEIKALNNQLIVIFNTVLTVVAAFAFGYKAPEMMLGKSNMEIQMMIGMILGTVVFFADLYFILRND